MTNLLPEEQKKKVIREYGTRRAIVGLFLLSSVGVIIGVALFPSYMVIQEQLRIAQNTLKNIEAAAKENDTTRYINELERANKLVDVLKPPESELRAHVVVDAILNNINSGVTLTSVALETEYASESDTEEKDEDRYGSIQISLSGIADTRETLTDFEQSMGEISYIDSVDLPVSSFAAREDISFTMRLVGNF